MNLFLFRYEAEKSYPLCKVEGFYQTFKRGAIVAGAGDIQSRLGQVESSERPDDGIDALVLLEPPEVHEQWLLRPLRRVWSETL